MYRTSADPNVREELHTLGVSTSKGSGLVGLLGGLALCSLVSLAVLYFKSEPGEVVEAQWVCGILTVLFTIPTYLLQRRRARTLHIFRHGETVHLVVDNTGVDLTFPLTCHGTQFSTRVNRVPSYEVFLQLIDGQKRSVSLHESRGAIHGPQEGWFPGDTDRSTTSQGAFDVSGAGTLAQIRGWVERLNQADEG
jgi:hypothetical protein